MRLVILDGYTKNPGNPDWRGMEALGDLTVCARTDHLQVKEKMQDADAIIINKVPMTKELMQESKQLHYIGVLATGYDAIDIEAVSDLHIVATNVPGYGTDAIAQYAIALLLEVAPRIGHHTKRVKRGEQTNNADWCFWGYPLMELSDRAIRIIGFGRTGRKIAEVVQVLGTHVLFHDTHTDNGTRAEKVSLKELLRRNDVISLHCPLTKKNGSLINKATLAMMKSNAILISNARGRLINEYDPIQALQNGVIHVTALDVVREEPIRNDNPSLECSNCLITSHISWTNKEARRRIMDTAVENLRYFLQGKEQNHIV